MNERSDDEHDSAVNPHNDDDDVDTLSGKLPPIVERLLAEQRDDNKKLPVCLLVVGMAGSGKTTLLRQLQESLLDRQQDTAAAIAKPTSSNDNITPTDKSKEEEICVENVKEGDEEEEDEEDEDSDDDDDPFYCVNLDPACLDVPYTVHLDIRDTIDYKQVMQQHQLGPNGAILTALNLYASKFDQVLRILEQRCLLPTEPEKDNKEEEKDKDETTNENNTLPPTRIDTILIDTPGQIEAFTWSASGSMISQALASAFPTVLVFVVDTARCAASPNTFMSNMLYCCSMVYRTRLPVVIAYNKNDVVHHTFCMEWMQDYETFQRALEDDAASGNGGYYSSLSQSLSLVLDEFYSGFAHACGVSAVTGAGMDEFWQAVDAAKKDFATDYVQDLKDRTEEQQARRRAIARAQARRMRRDVEEEE